MGRKSSLIESSKIKIQQWRTQVDPKRRRNSLRIFNIIMTEILRQRSRQKWLFNNPTSQGVGGRRIRALMECIWGQIWWRIEGDSSL
ncbi:hypothetical protein TorRG33x02_326770 [Trema orientale]|uniref:Uncharacterized protein n=1 Tax=Trema orientale TaxID=63057 RepID=A0A2P5BBL1_TREOI|nr:hypothetical protein TorRG33x02_326770 [Trema orientale]